MELPQQVRSQMEFGNEEMSGSGRQTRLAAPLQLSLIFGCDAVMTPGLL